MMDETDNNASEIATPDSTVAEPDVGQLTVVDINDQSIDGEVEGDPKATTTKGGKMASPASVLGLPDTRSVRARRWSTLDSITVRGFKAKKEATIPLDRVTILVGPNGCGKSSVLQAIHWAARSASYVLPKNTKEMISFERLDYVPSSDPFTTLHKGELKSDATSVPVEVVFSHRSLGEESVQSTIRIRAARNRGGITVYMDGVQPLPLTNNASNSSPPTFLVLLASQKKKLFWRNQLCVGKQQAAMPVVCFGIFYSTSAAEGRTNPTMQKGKNGSLS